MTGGGKPDTALAAVRTLIVCGRRATPGSPWLHQIGASRLGTILTSQTNIIPGHSGTYRHLRSRVPVLIAGFGSELAANPPVQTRGRARDTSAE